MHQDPFSAGALPQTSLGELMTLPRLPSWLTRGYLSSYPSSPDVFCVSISFRRANKKVWIRLYMFLGRRGPEWVSCRGARNLKWRHCIALLNKSSQSYIPGVTCHVGWTGRLVLDKPISRRDGRLSWPRWLGTYWDSTPFQVYVVTEPCVERWRCWVVSVVQTPIQTSLLKLDSSLNKMAVECFVCKWQYSCVCVW